MDRESVRRWIRGPEAVAAFEREERRAASPSKRFSLLCGIVQRGSHLGLRPSGPFDPEVSAVRERWCKLRKALGCQPGTPQEECL